MKINRLYTDEVIHEKMKEQFEEEGFIQLNNFLDEDIQSYKNSLMREKPCKNFKPGLISRKELTLKSLSTAKNIEFLEYFQSKEFIKFLEDIIGIELYLTDSRVCEYKRGDYILLNHSDEKEDCIDVIFDITAEEEWSESYGGELIYTTAEGDIFYISPTFNTLTILYKPQELLKYLKYINHLAEDKTILRIELKLEIKEE